MVQVGSGCCGDSIEMEENQLPNKDVAQTKGEYKEVLRYTEVTFRKFYLSLHKHIAYRVYM